MKLKKIAMALLMSLMMVSLAVATPTTSTTIIGGGGPVYNEVEFIPQIFLNEDGGRSLVDNNLPFLNGDITQRDGNYIFTGEQIIWEMLVVDKNGAPEKIHDVAAGWVEQNNGPLPPEAQANCALGEQLGNNALLANNGYPNVRIEGEEFDHERFDNDIMAIYKCTLTVEPSCQGQKWFGAEVEDIDGNTGQLQEAESWFCNPTFDLIVSGGSQGFGDLGPGEEGSMTVSIENAAEPGSGLEVALAISGTDFYDPTSSGAKCPTSNVLSLQGDGTDFTEGFWYEAVQGSHDTAKKRIPYDNGLISGADPIFSSGDGLTANWADTLVPTGPGVEATLVFGLGLPAPCNGHFPDGQIMVSGVAL